MKYGKGPPEEAAGTTSRVFSVVHVPIVHIEGRSEKDEVVQFVGVASRSNGTNHAGQAEHAPTSCDESRWHRLKSFRGAGALRTPPAVARSTVNSPRNYRRVAPEGGTDC